MESIVKIEKLSKSFRVGIQEVPVLKDVSFAIEKGDFVIIFGPSGCGKSTLLHSMLGLEVPTFGSVVVQGTNLYQNLHSEDDRSQFRKRHIGMVYQQTNWIKSLTVVENVAFPLYLHGVDQATANIKAGQILRNLKMDKWMNYNPGELSSGQQQRIALARALITNPGMIFADEPTGNLDFESGQELMSLLSETNRQGQTIIMVTHDLDYLSYAKTAIRMFDGKIVAIYRGAEKEELLKSSPGKRGGEKLALTEANFTHNSANMADFHAVMKSNNSTDKDLVSKPTPSTLLSLTISFFRTASKSSVFFILLAIYLINTQVVLKLARLSNRLNSTLLPRYLAFNSSVVRFFDTHAKDSISRIDLMEMAIKNMKAKKTRTLVTVGGMVIGIGAIVFLVSIGYGLQQLVITRVARLEEMKQADVTPQSGGKVRIDDKTLSDFKDISDVDMSLPLIAVVGRVNYQNSVSDMAVYGVTTDYLKQSAIKPIQGQIFESNELASPISTDSGQVAGAYIEAKYGEPGEKIQDINFTINPSAWIRVREEATANAKVLGYTKRVEGKSQGEEVWGSQYISDTNQGTAGQTETGETLGKWIKAPVLLWTEQPCDVVTQGDCEEGKYLVMRDADNQQIQKTGYFAQVNLVIEGTNIIPSRVLGITSETASESPQLVSNTNQTIDWVEIASEAGVVQAPDTKTLELAPSAKRQAVVNRAMLKVLGVSESEAVGKTFSTSFVVVGELLADPKEKIESAPAEYTIVGVTPEEKTPVFYVPFVDLRGLGVNNYSQVKVVVKNPADLLKVRGQLEAMGYVTRSVADTVAQINSLFVTAKAILALLGMVALGVAALGMFNTLTVSLLERTREVGLMKAMGMKSSEVQELFLTESMIMGFFGGVVGIILGFATGKLAGLALSLFAIFKGVGYVDISYVPPFFVLVIIFLSLLVGIVTGIYPAKRATKISALNALRYE